MFALIDDVGVSFARRFVTPVARKQLSITVSDVSFPDKADHGEVSGCFSKRERQVKRRVFR